MIFKGKFIVIYGANNLGKTTQAKLLVKNLRKLGKKVKYIKYPIYTLEPTGPVLDKYLRKGLKLDEYTAQLYYAQNRRDYEPKLLKKLDGGTWVVAEDYVGTAICWGTVHGRTTKEIENANSDLLKEELAILIDGDKRFIESIEKGHHNEDSGLWEKARNIHLKIGKKYGWIKVDSNQSVERVSADIRKIVKNKFRL